MRGTFFQKPFELVLTINGERWSQGEKVEGNLVVKTMDQSQTLPTDFGVGILFGDPKKVQKKDPKVFELFQKSLCQKLGTENHFQFNLEVNSPVSEKAMGTYIVCGNLKEFGSCALMEIQVAPRKSILYFLEIFQNFHRFNIKALKNKKGVIEYKMIPPSSKEFGAIDSLLLSIKENEGELELTYEFKIKKLSYGEGGVTAVDDKVKIKSKLAKKDYLAFGDTPNQDGINAAIRDVLDQIKRKTTY